MTDASNMIAAVAVAAIGLQSQADPVLFGYDCVEYFNLKEGATGVKGDSQYAYNLTTTDQSNYAEVRVSIVVL